MPTNGQGLWLARLKSPDTWLLDYRLLLSLPPVLARIVTAYYGPWISLRTPRTKPARPYDDKEENLKGNRIDFRIGLLPPIIHVYPKRSLYVQASSLRIARRHFVVTCVYDV